MEDLSPIRGRPSIWDVKIWVSKSEVVRFNGWLCPDETDLDDGFGGFIVKKRVVIKDGKCSRTAQDQQHQKPLGDIGG